MGLFRRISSAIGSVFGYERPQVRPQKRTWTEEDDKGDEQVFMADAKFGTTQRGGAERGEQQRGGQQRGPGDWQPSWFPHTELMQYLTGEIWVSVESSNVDRIAYDPRLNDGTLKVIFKDQNEYAVWPVSPFEAEAMYNASSHGRWYWDVVRVRGTKLGHKKNYVHVRSLGGVQRLWTETEDSVLAHLREVERQSLEKGSKAKSAIPESIPYEFFLTDQPQKSPRKIKNI